MVRFILTVVITTLTVAHGAASLTTIREHKNPYTKIAMLQKMATEIKTQVEEQSKAGITPEVQEQIDNMIALIDGDINGAINADYTAAQANYDAKLLAVQDAVIKLDEIKVDVIAADEAATTCIGQEEEMCRDWAACNDTMWEKCNTSIEECDDAEPYDWYPHQFFYEPHQCDFRYIVCDDISTLIDHKDDEETKLQNKLNEFIAETDECNYWRGECSTQTTECEGQWVDRVNKRTECNADQVSDRDDELSRFCEFWWQKCDKEHTLLLTKETIQRVSVDADGVVTDSASAGHLDENDEEYGLSELDRINEWNAVLEIKCLLISYTEGNEEDSTPHFDATLEAACLVEATYQYPNTFLYEEEEVTRLVDLYPCDDNSWTIQFNPFHWDEFYNRSVTPDDCNQYTYITDHHYVKGEMCPEWEPYR